MADAIVGTTTQVVLEKVLSLALDRIGLLLGFKEDLQRLKDSAEMIQKFLADAEDKQSKSRAVQVWLKKLQGVAYDTYYVLDELNYQVLRRQVKARDQLKGKVCSFFFLSKDAIAFRLKMASKVRDINIKLQTINQEAAQYGLIQKTAPALPPVSAQVATNRQTDSVAAPIVVGRENDVSEIVQMLLSPSEKVVSSIPIVGMGGLGKTTLAKSVFNNQQVDRHFNKKVWVCVSEKFEVMQLFKQILESLTRNKVELSNLDTVVQEIRREIEGKRYLLVLDDVWNEYQDLWDTFFNSLVGISTANGSKCLVTTRLRTTASIVSQYPPYDLSLLSDTECWSIITEKLIGSGEMSTELIRIRSHVVKKCQGLPLAANVIGGLLCRYGKHEWQSVVENKLSNSNRDHGSNIEQILKLSFENLPSPSIKKCFSYCSLFEKDTELERDRLIELWMAEGFLQSDIQDQMLMEETGDRYFNILVQSSLLEKEERWGIGYKMHDLVHDLAQSVSKLQPFDFENTAMNSSTIHRQVRHLELDMDRETMALNDASALILKSSSISNVMLRMFKSLHILILSQVEITELPSSIGKLKPLRFLDVSNNRMKRLPESICKLYNLQTLYLDSDNLEGLPQGMSNLISLRHLHYLVYNIQMPPEMGRLTCLQTLEFYNIGEEKGCQIEELGALKYLKGKLSIRNLELIKSREGAESANLCGKQNLTELQLSWGSTDRDGVAICDEPVLEGLKPHQNLKELKIKYFMGERLPQWVSNLTSLVALSLESCKRCKELPLISHLPCLETLELADIDISCIGVSFFGLDDSRGRLGSGSREGEVEVSKRNLFPALKNLKLSSLRNLVEWEEPEVSDEYVVFPVLENLAIEDCSQLLTAPKNFPSLNVSVVGRLLSIASSTLKFLKLDNMGDLTGLYDHQLGSSFTCIEVLDLLNCGDLIELTEELCQQESLRELNIANCPKLVRVGPPPNAKKHLISMEDFVICDCEGLSSITKETLEWSSSLSFLCVSGCPNLTSFPLDLRKFPSLSRFDLYKCPKLFADKNNLPRGFDHLTNLRTISLGPFSNDDYSMELFEDCSGLMSCSSRLRTLVLYGSGHLDSLLLNQFQHFTSLECLSLNEFESLETLPDWFGSLLSLRELWINSCPKLRCLPSLTNLRSIELRRCPLLKERYSTGRGSDSEWFKISQLPNLKIT